MDRIKELLGKFELVPSKDFHVFGSDSILAASEIEANYRNSEYDHRLFLPALDPVTLLHEVVWSEEYRKGYACFKREVAKVLRPESILEIGIGLGVSALAFLDGCPSAKYMGIDDDSDYYKKLFSAKPTQYISSVMFEKGYHNRKIISMDSTKMDRFPFCELVHIDGDHKRETVRHDFTLAWESEARWILCDDTRDSEVVGGIFDSLSMDLKRGSIDWAYFPDTWTGNILVRTAHHRRG